MYSSRFFFFFFFHNVDEFVAHDGMFGTAFEATLPRAHTVQNDPNLGARTPSSAASSDSGGSSDLASPTSLSTWRSSIPVIQKCVSPSCRDGHSKVTCADPSKVAYVDPSTHQVLLWDDDSFPSDQEDSEFFYEDENSLEFSRAFNNTPDLPN